MDRHSPTPYIHWETAINNSKIAPDTKTPQKSFLIDAPNTDDPDDADYDADYDASDVPNATENDAGSTYS